MGKNHLWMGNFQHANGLDCERLLGEKTNTNSRDRMGTKKTLHIPNADSLFTFKIHLNLSTHDPSPKSMRSALQCLCDCCTRWSMLGARGRQLTAFDEGPTPVECWARSFWHCTCHGSRLLGWSANDKCAPVCPECPSISDIQCAYPIPRPEMALANTSILPIYWSQYLQLVDQSANDSRRDRLPPISHHRRKHRKRDKSKKFQYYIIYHNIITHPHNRSTYQSIGLHESGNISLSFHCRTRSTFIQQLFPRKEQLLQTRCQSPCAQGAIVEIFLYPESNRSPCCAESINHPQHQKQQETTSWAATCVCYIVTASLEKMKKVRTLSSQVANTQKWHSLIITV